MFPPRIFIICTLPLIARAGQLQVTPFVHHELPSQSQYRQPHPRHVQPQPHHAQHNQAPRQYTQYTAHRPVTRPGYGPAPVLPGHQVAVELHGPGVVRKGPGHNKCQLDYVESHEEVCIPTFKTDCDKEDVPGGVVIKHHDQCDDVVKTVCTEHHDIDDMEVCAYSVSMLAVEAEAKVSTAVWKETCHEVKECVPAPVQGYHAPACNQVIRHECHQDPSLVTVSKPVHVKLPQPEQTCIIKQVLLPRVECQQVKERRCMLVPRAMPGPEVKIDKCSVEVGEPQCSEVILQLPRQKCPSKLVSYH